jgi:hypothetical protein
LINKVKLLVIEELAITTPNVIAEILPFENTCGKQYVKLPEYQRCPFIKLIFRSFCVYVLWL